MRVFILLFLIPGSLSSCPAPVVAPSEVVVALGSCLYIPCRYDLCQATMLRTFSWLHHPRYDSSRKGFVGQEVAKVQWNPKKIQGDCRLVLPQVGISHGGLYGLRLVALQGKSPGKLPWIHMVNVSVTATMPPPHLWPLPASLTHGLMTTFGCWLPPTCSEATSSLAWGPPGNIQSLGGTVNTWTPPASVTSDPAMGISLTFTPNWDQDGTLLTCSLQGAAGEVLSKVERRLQVNYAPQKVRVEVTPASPVHEGQEVTLSCRDLAKPQSKHYSWALNDQSLPHHLPQLHLSSTKASDGGTYRCWATNDLGTAESLPANLEVHYPPHVPWLEVTPRPPVHEGQKVTLSCKASANPLPHSYSWSRDGQPLAHQGAQLVLGSVDATSHEGSYQCRAANRLGMAWSAPTHLEIFYPPREATLEALTPLPALEGSPITLRCSLGPAHPAPPTVQWLRDDAWQVTTPGDNLTFQADPAHAGSYRCVGHNAAGSTCSLPLTVSIWYRPRSIKVQQIPGGPVRAGGGPVRLQCLVGGAEPPQLEVTWYKDGRLMTFDPTASDPVTFDPTTFELTLGPPLPAEASFFSCHARNAVGGARSRPLQLDVLFAPWGVQLEAEPGWAVPEHSDVTLRCHARARPPPSGFSWYCNGHQLGTSKEGLWLLAAVGPGAAGRYRCHVSNPQGVAESPEGILSIQISSSTLLRRTSLGLGVASAALLLGILGGLLWRWWQQRVAAEPALEVAPGRTFCIYRKQHLPCQNLSDIIGTSTPPPALIGSEPRGAPGDPSLQRSPGACKAPEGPDYENLSPGAISGAVGATEGSLVYATLALATPRPPGSHREHLEDTTVDYVTLRH